MNLAWLSLIALVIAIVVSCVTQLNVGVLALAFAWIVGVYLGGMKLDEVIAGFPASLFLTLAGVTLLFAQAQTNGTLDRIAHRAVRLCRRNAGFIPIMFFLLGFAIASAGPGNVATAAMLAPMGLAAAHRAGVPPFLMIIMLGNGAQAGSLSPVAPTGLIVHGLMNKVGLAGHDWWTYWTNAAAHATVAFSGYLAFGGLRLFARAHVVPPQLDPLAMARFDAKNWITLSVVLAVMAAVLGFKTNIGMTAFAGAVVLAALRVADHDQAIKKVPWGTILMVTGVTILISLLEKTGGLDLFTALLARFASPSTLTAMVAFVTGIISVYSSTSGVVLPAFIPTIPGLVQRLGGDPLAIAASMNIGAHLVDMSPLSTTGAVSLAAIANPSDVRPTYNKLLAWGFSMSVVAAVGCYLFL